MLSTRGQAYSKSGLMTGYMRPKIEPFDKHTNPNGEISFSNAENFLMQEEILNYINTHHHFSPRTMTYNEGPIGTHRLRAAMASHLNNYFRPVVPVTAEHVTFTAGVTGLNEMMAFNLTDEGEGILLGRPIYGSFYDDLITKSKCELVYTGFGEVDQFSGDAVKVYEEAILQAEKDGVRVRALLLCNPHNPLGKCYPVETLKGLMGLCEKHNLHLISDEIYALSVFEIEGEEKTPFRSVLSIDPEGLLSKERIHILYGMSKDFGAAGLRLGCLISQNEEMNTATRAIGRFHWPSEMSCEIATTILEDQTFVAEYTRKSRLVLAQNYSLARKILDEAGIKFVRDGNAGFFLWIDLSPFLSCSKPDTEGWDSEKEFKSKLSEVGVQLASGFAYKAERPGWFRVIFAVDVESLEEGLRRIIKTAREQE